VATRPQKIKVGVFLLVNVVCITGALAYIAGMRGGDNVRYHVAFDESVLGLTEGGLVQYGGVPVGRVENIRVGQDNLVHTAIIVDREKVALREGVTARLEIYSIATGVMCIALYGGDLEGEPLAPGSVIEATPSTVKSVSSRIAQVFDDVGDIVERINIGLEGMPPGELARTVADLREAVQETQALAEDTRGVVAQLGGDLEGMSGELHAGLASFRSGMESLTALSDETVVLARTANETVGMLRDKVEPVDVAGLVGELRTEISNLSEGLDETLTSVDGASKILVHQTDNVQYSMVETMKAMNETLEAVRELARYLRDDPASVLTGKGRPRGIE